MTMKKWDGASWVDITVAKKWDGASWVTLTSAKKWDGATWVTIPLPGVSGLQAVVAPLASTGLESRGNPCPPCPAFVTVTGNNVTVTPSGGIGAGPNIVWSRTSGSASITATASTSFTTAFTASVPQNTTLTAVFRGRVTQGVETKDVFVNVSLRYEIEF